jgi:hypothetical protein
VLSRLRSSECGSSSARLIMYPQGGSERGRAVGVGGLWSSSPSATPRVEELPGPGTRSCNVRPPFGVSVQSAPSRTVRGSRSLRSGNHGALRGVEEERSRALSPLRPCLVFWSYLGLRTLVAPAGRLQVSEGSRRLSPPVLPFGVQTGVSIRRLGSCGSTKRAFIITRSGSSER